MKFETTHTGEPFEEELVEDVIRCFDEHGESGPHSHEGRLLSHILNHCYKNDIPFSLVYLPNRCYYVVRGVVDGVMPAEVKRSFEED